MPINNLDQRAVLAIWPSAQPGGSAEGREFATVLDAVRAAIDALRETGARPWMYALALKMPDYSPSQHINIPFAFLHR